MKKKQVQIEYQKKIKLINNLNKLYYDKSQPAATDEDFDDRAMEVFGFLLILSSIGYVLWYLNRVIG